MAAHTGLIEIPWLFYRDDDDFRDFIRALSDCQVRHQQQRVRPGLYDVSPREFCTVWVDESQVREVAKLIAFLFFEVEQTADVESLTVCPACLEPIESQKTCPSCQLELTGDGRRDDDTLYQFVVKNGGLEQRETNDSEVD